MWPKGISYNNLIQHITVLQETVKQTAVEFTQSGSLHGMQYIFESGKNLLSSRVIWTALVVIATVVGIVWSLQVCKTHTERI